MWSNLRNFYFTKCSPLKLYKADLKHNCKIAKNHKILHFGQIANSLSQIFQLYVTLIPYLSYTLNARM